MDAAAVNFLDIVLFPEELWHDLLNDFEQVLGSGFAGGSFINTRGGFGDAVSAVVIPPGLNGAPSELARTTVLIKEGHVGDGLVAGEVGCSLGVFECSEDSHFEVVADVFHRTRAKLTKRCAGVGLPYPVAVKIDFPLQMDSDVKSATVRYFYGYAETK